MKLRVALAILVLGSGGVLLACTLNPQPLPPDSMSATDGDCGVKNDANGTPYFPDASIDASFGDGGRADAGDGSANMDAGDADDAGDAGTSDGGSDGQADASDGATDAQGD